MARALQPDALTARVPTSALAAAGLIAGFGAATGTGSRPFGGVVMAALGLPCIYVWMQRDGTPTTVKLTAAGLGAFAFSHVLGLAIGPWPSVLTVSAATAGLYWRVSDSRALSR